MKRSTERGVKNVPKYLKRCMNTTIEIPYIVAYMKVFFCPKVQCKILEIIGAGTSRLYTNGRKTIFSS